MATPIATHAEDSRFSSTDTKELLRECPWKQPLDERQAFYKIIARQVRLRDLRLEDEDVFAERAFKRGATRYELQLMDEVLYDENLPVEDREITFAWMAGVIAGEF